MKKIVRALCCVAVWFIVQIATLVIVAMLLPEQPDGTVSLTGLSLLFCIVVPIICAVFVSFSFSKKEDAKRTAHTFENANSQAYNFSKYEEPSQQHGPTVTKMMEKFEREEKEFEEEMRLMRERFENEMFSMKQTAAELQWRQQASGLSYTDFELSRIDSMDGPMFEQWCADLLKKCGYENVSVSGKSGDQGVDIIAEKDDIRYAIQCKCYSSPLGNTPVQEVYAGKTKHNCFIAAVMTNNYFTKGAKELASATNVLLWDRDKLKKMLDNSGKA